jgi:hypothetical protein
MAPRTRLIALLLGGAAILVLAVLWFAIAAEHKEGTSWSASERADFMRSCVEQCRASAGMTQDRYPLCDSACSCAADEGERTTTVQELAVAVQAITSGKASTEQTAMMDRLKAAGLRCATGTAPAKQ